MSTPSSVAAFSGEFAAAFSSGKVDAILELYDEAGVLIGERGTAFRGRDSIRSLLKSSVGSGTVMSISPRFAVESGDLALLINDFEVQVDGRVVLRSTSVEVLKREDGRWKLLIDLPFGVNSFAA